MECLKCYADLDNPGDSSVKFIACPDCGADNKSIWFCEDANPLGCLQVKHCDGCGNPIANPSNPTCPACNKPFVKRFSFRESTYDEGAQNAALVSAEIRGIGGKDCASLIETSDRRTAALDPDFSPSRPHALPPEWADTYSDRASDSDSASDSDLDDAEALQQKQASKKRAREEELVGSAPNSEQSEGKACRNSGPPGKRRAKLMEKWDERADLSKPAKEEGKQKAAPHRIMGQTRGTWEEEGVESEGEREDIMQGLEEQHEFDNHGCRESQKAMMQVAMMRKDNARYGSEDPRTGNIRPDGIVNTYPKFMAQMWDPPEGIFTGRGSKKIEVTHDYRKAKFEGEFDSLNDFVPANRDRAVAYCTRIAETEARRAGGGGGKKWLDMTKKMQRRKVEHLLKSRMNGFDEMVKCRLWYIEHREELARPAKPAKPAKPAEASGSRSGDQDEAVDDYEEEDHSDQDFSQLPGVHEQSDDEDSDDENWMVKAQQKEDRRAGK